MRYRIGRIWGLLEERIWRTREERRRKRRGRKIIEKRGDFNNRPMIRKGNILKMHSGIKKPASEIHCSIHKNLPADPCGKVKPMRIYKEKVRS